MVVSIFAGVYMMFICSDVSAKARYHDSVQSWTCRRETRQMCSVVGTELQVEFEDDFGTSTQRVLTAVLWHRVTDCFYFIFLFFI